jgi:hypothetical protein
MQMSTYAHEHDEMATSLRSDDGEANPLFEMYDNADISPAKHHNTSSHKAHVVRAPARIVDHTSTTSMAHSGSTGNRHAHSTTFGLPTPMLSQSTNYGMSAILHGQSTSTPQSNSLPVATSAVAVSPPEGRLVCPNAPGNLRYGAVPSWAVEAGGAGILGADADFMLPTPLMSQSSQLHDDLSSDDE